jgi:hypothetical protein
VPQPFADEKASIYGQLVQAAYAMFRNPGPDPLRPVPVGIPQGYEVGAWIQMCDFLFDDQVPKFYGIVVHETKSTDSRVIAIRGTETPLEWLDDAFALPVPFRRVPSAGRVAHGFDRIYSSMKVVKRPLPKLPPLAVPETYTGSFAEQLDQEVTSREIERGETAPVGHPRPERPTAVVGHSLGSALATLFVMENASKRKFDISTCCTFASPRVGDAEFVHLFNQLQITSWRVFNARDVVPRLPLKVPILADYEHVNEAVRIDSSPFAKNNLLCWHEMATYLHMIDDTFPLSEECNPKV